MRYAFDGSKLKDMKVGEGIDVGFEIVAVPGGWVFMQGNGNAAVFVPRPQCDCEYHMAQELDAEIPFG